MALDIRYRVISSLCCIFGSRKNKGKKLIYESFEKCGEWFSVVFKFKPGNHSFLLPAVLKIDIRRIFSGFEMRVSKDSKETLGPWLFGDGNKTTHQFQTLKDVWKGMIKKWNQISLTAGKV